MLQQWQRAKGRLGWHFPELYETDTNSFTFCGLHTALLFTYQDYGST